jgi:curli production assembly/transport component CsgG
MLREQGRNVRNGLKAFCLLALVATGLSGCAQEIAEREVGEQLLPPVVNQITEVNRSLRDLPPPQNKVVAAVYDYADQTGQFKPSDVGQTLSRAVTQGATSVLIKALQDVGDGSWFTVVEREKVANLLKERQIITQMRMTYLGEQQISPQALPPLLFAAIIFEGGIIGFDSNTQTGGIGAGLLGISGDIKYRLDTITVYLRAVSTKTGQVLASVTTHKTIASVAVQGGAFKYIAIDKILEAEAGITKNEPDQLAVQQAIEKAVHTIIVEGAGKGIWSFADEVAQDELIRSHAEEYETSDGGGPSAKDGEQNEATASAADMTPTSSLPANGWEAGEQQVASKPDTAQQPGTMLASAVAQPQHPPGWRSTILPMEETADSGGGAQ